MGWRVINAPESVGDVHAQPVGDAAWGEIKNGRVESDGNGRVRLRAGALAEDVIEALARFVD